jgi:hypothetical protein
MFNLRQLNPSGSQLSSRAEQHFNMSTLRFSVYSEFLGNIGEPLDYGQSEQAIANADDGNLDPGPGHEDNCEGSYRPYLEHIGSSQVSAPSVDFNGEAIRSVRNTDSTDTLPIFILCSAKSNHTRPGSGCIICCLDGPTLGMVMN